MPDASGELLGGLSEGEFLRRFWQKRPLLVRGALRGRGLDPGLRTLFRLARRDDVDARLIERSSRGWRVAQAPLERAVLEALGDERWTLLVHDLELHLPVAERLLRRFGFLSWARIDDVMVSYAATGGGVGPHFDSYDVFLVQGPGRRRWQLARPRRWRIENDAPLKLIEGFRAEIEYVLEPGDLLYLPTGWGHDGVALEPGFTWSIGARAPHAAELASSFLDYLQEHRLPAGEYRDPGRTPAKSPAHIDTDMLRKAEAMLAPLRWRRADVAEALGEYLSSPKAHVFFTPPRKALARSAFGRSLASNRVRLDPRTRLLRRARRFFVNGDGFTPPPAAHAALAALADRRVLDGRTVASGGQADLIFEWYRRGWVGLERKE
ncbi:MAG: cupin domain-containing protein [Betaproteobacteria bacterium]|nr:cupin domain-containing protein [Betaproteobacteria bacterium]